MLIYVLDDALLAKVEGPLVAPMYKGDEDHKSRIAEEFSIQGSESAKLLLVGMSTFWQSLGMAAGMLPVKMWSQAIVSTALTSVLWAYIAQTPVLYVALWSVAFVAGIGLLVAGSIWMANQRSRIAITNRRVLGLDFHSTRIEIPLNRAKVSAYQDMILIQDVSDLRRTLSVHGKIPDALVDILGLDRSN